MILSTFPGLSFHGASFFHSVVIALLQHSMPFIPRCRTSSVLAWMIESRI